LKTYILFLFFPLTTLVGCGIGESAKTEIVNADSIETKIVTKNIFGIDTDSFTLVEGVIKHNEFLADILLDYNVPYPTIHQIAMQSKEIFDVRKLERGKPYTIFCKKDSGQLAEYFVYQPNDIDYVVYQFSSDSISIYIGHKPVTLVEKQVQGIINSSLYEALQDGDQNIMLAFELADIFAWTIDFYRLQKGDFFNIIFEEKEVDGKPIGIDNIKAVLFNHEGRDFYAYFFEQDSMGGDYFDDSAVSLRKTFLKTPLKFSRLTSGYTRRRFHPVQKRYKAHLGTDYAAPRGTPILSTGDGKVVESGYKKYNGNYVKIKHNSIYMTQYLHMNKIKSGIKRGTYVKQGDIIGYVGSTGLATGPHVCYRFWKHGSQVNHLKEEFPPSEPVKEKNIEAYYKFITPFQERLKKEFTKA